jgi:hypothetical protein
MESRKCINRVFDNLISKPKWGTVFLFCRVQFFLLRPARNMIPVEVLLNDVHRQRLRDDRLWTRELQRARLLNLMQLHCLCSQCKGSRRFKLAIVRQHLIRNGRDPDFRIWRGLGDQESFDEEWEEIWSTADQGRRQLLDAQEDMRGMIQDAFEQEDEAGPLRERVEEVVVDAFIVADNIHEECRSSQNWDETCFPNPNAENVPDAGNNTEDRDPVNFDPEAMEDAVQELYTEAKSSKLAANILLLNLCTVHVVNNCFVDELFSILHAHLLPDGNSLPKNHYAARTLTKKLGLAYTSIHACESGCVLFRGEYANETTCPKCRSSRFKDQKRKKFPVKVLRHFPVIPRLQRLFRSPTISRLMRWHSENRSDRDGGDNLVRHPCDSKAWHHFHDNVDPTFREDARNVHFALAADGVNPFKQTRSTWSTWPVTLLNYNLPPWLCTKKFFVLLALLIPWKESVTSEVIDVYLEPLVEELLQLWYGIPAYDITKEPTLRTFTLRAVLLWTIHDFPGYGTVGGFSHQGYAACLWCGPDLGAEYSLELGKQTYGGTRRWLPTHHRYRSVEMKDHFDGKVDDR